MYGRADGMPSFLESMVVCDRILLNLIYNLSCAPPAWVERNFSVALLPPLGFSARLLNGISLCNEKRIFNVLSTFRSNVFHGVLEYSTVRVSAIAITISHNDEITSK
jgi:hypothetical protein